MLDKKLIQMRKMKKCYVLKFFMSVFNILFYNLLSCRFISYDGSNYRTSSLETIYLQSEL